MTGWSSTTPWRMLGREPLWSYDLIVAADALVYIGDLAPLFVAVETALTADGLFAFSVETAGRRIQS